METGVLICERLHHWLIAEAARVRRHFVRGYDDAVRRRINVAAERPVGQHLPELSRETLIPFVCFGAV